MHTGVEINVIEKEKSNHSLYSKSNTYLQNIMLLAVNKTCGRMNIQCLIGTTRRPRNHGKNKWKFVDVYVNSKCGDEYHLSRQRQNLTASQIIL